MDLASFLSLLIISVIPRNFLWFYPFSAVTADHWNGHDFVVHHSRKHYILRWMRRGGKKQEIRSIQFCSTLNFQTEHINRLELPTGFLSIARKHSQHVHLNMTEFLYEQKFALKNSLPNGRAHQQWWRSGGVEEMDIIKIISEASEEWNLS